MIKKTLKMNLALGLHARPSSLIVSRIIPLKLDKAIISYKDKVADLNSILSVLSLFIIKGSEVDVLLVGPNEDVALKIIEDVFNEKDIESIYGSSV